MIIDKEKKEEDIIQDKEVLLYKLYGISSNKWTKEQNILE